MKKVSVVIPCFNATEYLDRCMEHIVGQTIGLENIEIILVDDASTDGGKPGVKFCLLKKNFRILL